MAITTSARTACKVFVVSAALGGLLVFVTGSPRSATAGSPPSTQAGSQKTLYERLGGYDAISAVVSDFGNRLFADPKLASSFGGLPPDRQARFKQLNVLMVCAATGGPCTYIGRAMPATHQGMKITDMQFDQVAAHLVTTLDKFKVPQPEKGELLAIIGGLRGDIVGK